MQRAIKTRQFTFVLPPTVRNHVSKPTGKRPALSASYDDDKPAKRSPVHNKNRISRWKLKDGEDYRKIFAEKNISKRPTMDGVNVCPRWHIKGICFTGCNLASTYIPLTNPAVCRQMDTYCQVCRAEAGP